MELIFISLLDEIALVSFQEVVSFGVLYLNWLPLADDCVAILIFLRESLISSNIWGFLNNLRCCL